MTNSFVRFSQLDLLHLQDGMKPPELMAAEMLNYVFPVNMHRFIFLTNRMKNKDEIKCNC